MAITCISLMIFLALSFLSVSTASLDPFFASNPPPPQSQPLFTSPPSHQPSHQEVLDQSVFTSTLLAPILSHLGFNELATAAPSLSTDSTVFPSAVISWGGPYTIFAASDSSIRTCVSCSTTSLLREHMVPGLLTADYLRKLIFGTKIETLSPGRCITVTATMNNHKNSTVHKIFIGGVEITHPDLFNNGLIIIHGLQGYISPLSPFSCDVERMTSLSFPSQLDRTHNFHFPQPQNVAMMRFMLRDAILRLRNNGFSVLSLAMKIKYAELVSLNNATIFALEDVTIFSGSYVYISSIRYHIVPNQFLTITDLENLPAGTMLPTLDRGQNLVVTTAGAGTMGGLMRINYVRIKVADVVRNLKIIVHSIYLPFPHVHPSILDTDGEFGGEPRTTTMAGIDDACNALNAHGGNCRMGQLNNPFSAQARPPMPEIEDHHGL